MLGAILTTVFLAMAQPNFPLGTLNELQLVEAQAENLTLAQQGLQPYGQITSQNTANIASIITLFQGLYRGLQSWNEWQGGDDYIVRRQAVLETTELPEWLANYSGEVIMWELEYFGHTVTMLTDPQGNIIVNNGTKGLNVTIKNEMRQASAQYKVENPDPSRMNKPRGQVSYSENQLQTPSDNSVFQLIKPYIQGNSLFFTVYINNVPHLIQLKDFSNTMVGGLSMTTWNQVHMPYFKVQTGSHPLEFRDITTGVDLASHNPSGSYGGGICKCPEFSTDVLQYRWYGTPGQVKWFLPCTGHYYNRGSEDLRFLGNGLVTAFGYGNSIYPSFIQGQDGFSSGVNLGLYLEVSAGQTPTSTQNIKVPASNTISAQSLEQIQDAIAQIEPEVDPQTGIEILPIPDAFPEAENVPLEVETPEPAIPPSIEDFPLSDPEQVPESDPTINPSTEATEQTLPDSAENIPVQENLSIVTGLQNRFPFSIPWDIYNALKMLSAERQVPHWEWEMSVNLPTGGTFTHTFILDLAFLNDVTRLFRDLFLLGFILGLAVFSYNKFFGGGA